MSLTNAISAVAVVGSLIIAGEEKTVLGTVLGTIAVAASMANIVSGFLITDRMLKMFRDRGPRS
jgi:NAD(P) transhydrogenase subunit alpha